MKRILFIHNLLTRFVQIDRDLLRTRYVLTECHEQRPSSIRPLQIRRAVRAHDLVFCWFASWHSLLPVWFARRYGKPSVVVIGGYDTANIPEAGYGMQRGGIRRFVSRQVIRSATHLLAFSESGREEAIRIGGADPPRLRVTYLGVQPFALGPLEGRSKIVLTVGNVWRENLLRKGLLPFVRAAAYLPDARFIHVGRWCDESILTLRREATSNVEFLGFRPDAELKELYQQASVYVQASLHEGFGLSVAEAMTAGCIPAVTRAASLPEVVGDAGVYARSTSPADLASAIRQALFFGPEARLKARERIIDLFPLKRREFALFEVIDDSLLNKSNTARE